MGRYKFMSAAILIAVLAASCTGAVEPSPAPEQGTFTDLFDLEGHWVREEESPYFYATRYYVRTEQGEVEVARSFGPERSDYMQDVDGDGVKELICNVVYGDGTQRVALYRRVGEEILQAELNWDALDFEPHFDPTAWGKDYNPELSWQHYLIPRSNMTYDGQSLFISYPVDLKGADFITETFPLSLELFQFEPYASLAE